MAFLSCCYCKKLFYTSHKDRAKYCSFLCYKTFQKRFVPSYSWLFQKYVIEKLSIYKIAKLLNRDPTIIYKYLKSFKINLRNKSQARLVISDEISSKIKGKNHPNWKGGVSNLNALIRSSKEYRNWKISVLQRDKYKCKECGKNGKANSGIVEAHHIKPFIDFPEFRFDIENGQTLCVKCHKIYHIKNKNSVI